MDKAVVIAAILISMVVFFPGCIRIGENLPPEPDLKASATFIDVNETVIFSANDSFDRDGEITKYYWDFDDGTNATGPYVSHDYEKGGNYTVVLIITDNEDKKAVLAMTVGGVLWLVLPAVYVAASNLALVPLTGQNMPFLGLNSWADVILVSGLATGIVFGLAALDERPDQGGEA